MKRATRGLECFPWNFGLRIIVIVLLMCLLPLFPALAQTVAEAVQMPVEQLRAHAAWLRQERNWPAAIAAYQELLRREPHNAEDRFWLALVTGWSGDFTIAQQMLRELLQADPRNYDVRVALADTYTWQQNYQVALIELEKLDRDFPNRTDILLRLGQLHRWLGKDKTARQYFTQVLQHEPDNAAAQDGLRHLATAMNWELRLEYAGEQNSFAPAAHVGTFALARIGEGRKTTWTALSTIASRFGQTDARLGTEVNHRLRNGTVLRWAAFVAPKADAIAQQAYAVALARRLGPRMALDAGYAFLSFRHARTQQLTPQLDFYFRPGTWVTGRYTFARTSYHDLPRSAFSHAGGMSFNHQHNSSDFFQASYSYGSEAFDLTTVDRLGHFRAHTISGTWRHFISPRQGFTMSYSYQMRSGGARQQAYSFGLIRRW